jgi:VCBS repeat-containing protein
MDLLSNDSDPEGTPLTIFIVANPTHGTISLDANGKYKYTSASNYVGSDQFTYYVKDGSSDQLASSNATVNITVNASGTNHAPTVVNDTDNTVVNQDVSTDVIANDSDQDGDAISVSISASGLQAPSHGTIQLLGNGQISYTPNANYTGTDTYEYQVCDNNVSCSGTNGNLCSIGTVTINIQALPILISGTVWNDVDKSANNTFNSIRNGSEIGSNAFNGLYAHLVDASNNVIDQAPIAYDGTYIFTNAPSNASNLKIVINSQLYALGTVDANGSLPTGFVATTPSSTATFTTSTANITGQDFGINQLPTANSFTLQNRLTLHLQA